MTIWRELRGRSEGEKLGKVSLTRLRFSLPSIFVVIALFGLGLTLNRVTWRHRHFSTGVVSASTRVSNAESKGFPFSYSMVFEDGSFDNIQAPPEKRRRARLERPTALWGNIAVWTFIVAAYPVLEARATRNRSAIERD